MQSLRSSVEGEEPEGSASNLIHQNLLDMSKPGASGPAGDFESGAGDPPKQYEPDLLDMSKPGASGPAGDFESGAGDPPKQHEPGTHITGTVRVKVSENIPVYDRSDPLIEIEEFKLGYQKNCCLADFEEVYCKTYMGGGLKSLLNMGEYVKCLSIIEDDLIMKPLSWFEDNGRGYITYPKFHGTLYRYFILNNESLWNSSGSSEAGSFKLPMIVAIRALLMFIIRLHKRHMFHGSFLSGCFVTGEPSGADQRLVLRCVCPAFEKLWTDSTEFKQLTEDSTKLKQLQKKDFRHLADFVEELLMAVDPSVLEVTSEISDFNHRLRGDEVNVFDLLHHGMVLNVFEKVSVLKYQETMAFDSHKDEFPYHVSEFRSEYWTTDYKGAINKMANSFHRYPGVGKMYDRTSVAVALNVDRTRGVILLFAYDPPRYFLKFGRHTSNHFVDLPRSVQAELGGTIENALRKFAYTYPLMIVHIVDYCRSRNHLQHHLLVI